MIFTCAILHLQILINISNVNSMFSATACRDPGIVFDSSDDSDNSNAEDEERGVCAIKFMIR